MLKASDELQPVGPQYPAQKSVRLLCTMPFPLPHDCQSLFNAVACTLVYSSPLCFITSCSGVCAIIYFLSNLKTKVLCNFAMNQMPSDQGVWLPSWKFTSTDMNEFSQHPQWGPGQSKEGLSPHVGVGKAWQSCM